MKIINNLTAKDFEGATTIAVPIGMMWRDGITWRVPLAGYFISAISIPDAEVKAVELANTKAAGGEVLEVTIGNPKA